MERWIADLISSFATFLLIREMLNNAVQGPYKMVWRSLLYAVAKVIQVRLVDRLTSTKTQVS